MEAGYLTDVEYTGDFHDHLAPAWLSYIAAINGYASPSLSRSFAWCELGCGRGITSLLLAATHPNGQFHACDINPAHIEYAERLRNAGSVSNVGFHCRRIAEMTDADLPDFDFIVLHGVYSWVPDSVRDEIRNFIRRRLKPGGLVSISYNAMPGWAHLQPIRHLMNAYAAALPAGNSIERAQKAFAYADFLARNGAGYFAQVPAAAQHLRQIATQDIRYVAHEYVTPHGDPFYFPEVDAAMRAAGLAFAGSMNPEDNYLPLMAPPQFHKLLADSPSREELEARRDFMANTRFRRDLYAAQPRAVPTSDIPLDRLEAVDFCLTGLPEQLPLNSRDGSVRFNLDDQAGLVRAVHQLLLSGPARARDIHLATGLASTIETSFLIQQLVVSRHLAPCPPVRAGSGWMPVNSAMVEAGIREQLPRVPLAAPLTGGATYSEVVHAATLESSTRFATADAAARAVLARLRESGHPVVRQTSAGERRAATDAEVLAHVAASWRALNDAGHPSRRVSRLLGVVS